MNQYTWNIKSFAKGIDPELAAAEFERIENVYGSLTAETILGASTPEDALFHNLFEWDDSEAATQYRLHQARTIINNIQLTIVSDGQPRQVAAYEIIKTSSGRSYKSITSFTTSEIEQVKMRTLRELIAFKEKLRVYEKFESVIADIDVTIGSISKIAI